MTIDEQKFGELLGRFSSLCDRCERCQTAMEIDRVASGETRRGLAEHIAWHKATEHSDLEHRQEDDRGSAAVRWRIQMGIMILGITSGGISAALVTFALNFVFRR